MNNTNDIYNTKLTTYFNSIINSKYLFEVTKCCGYSEFVSLYKDYTFLNDLYKKKPGDDDHIPPGNRLYN